jgi:hypothetical protein
MSSIVHLPEQFKIVTGTPVVTTNTGIICDRVSLKNVNMAWIVIEALQVASHATVINPMRSTAVGTGGAAIGHNAPNWKNANIATNDTLVRGADATTVSLTVGTNNQLVVIQIDPAQMGDTYDVLGCVITDSTNANNYMTVTYFLEMRYAQATPPSAILD